MWALQPTPGRGQHLQNSAVPGMFRVALSFSTSSWNEGCPSSKWQASSLWLRSVKYFCLNFLILCKRLLREMSSYCSGFCELWYIGDYYFLIALVLSGIVLKVTFFRRLAHGYCGRSTRAVYDSKKSIKKEIIWSFPVFSMLRSFVFIGFDVTCCTFVNQRESVSALLHQMVLEDNFTLQLCSISFFLLLFSVQSTGKAFMLMMYG